MIKRISMNVSHILDIRETHDEDESTRSYQYQQYSTITGTKLNNSGEIRIPIESQDEFFIRTTFIYCLLVN